ncbi:hypothetical protein NicSoilB8_46700 (plasmid) [Arthrobacter sp. NicSoilB8]|nr:hypothetical protein NicSoilB8_46700 [Arthrobacter sp. NicSoilB8]
MSRNVPDYRPGGAAGSLDPGGSGLDAPFQRAGQNRLGVRIHPGVLASFLQSAARGLFPAAGLAQRVSGTSARCRKLALPGPR